MGELIATIGTERTKVDKAMIIVAGTKENHILRYFIMRLAKNMTILVLVHTT